MIPIERAKGKDLTQAVYGYGSKTLNFKNQDFQEIQKSDKGKGSVYMLIKMRHDNKTNKHFRSWKRQKCLWEGWIR